MGSKYSLNFWLLSNYENIVKLKIIFSLMSLIDCHKYEKSTFGHNSSLSSSLSFSLSQEILIQDWNRNSQKYALCIGV